MVGKGQCYMLPYLVARNLQVLYLIPPVVKEERDRWMWWLCDYSFSKIKFSTLPIAELSNMRYGQALNSLLQGTIFADPDLRPVYMLKYDVAAFTALASALLMPQKLVLSSPWITATNLWSPYP